MLRKAAYQVDLLGRLKRRLRGTRRSLREIQKLKCLAMTASAVLCSEGTYHSRDCCTVNGRRLHAIVCFTFASGLCDLLFTGSSVSHQTPPARLLRGACAAPLLASGAMPEVLVLQHRPDLRLVPC